jgi:hypothetical protein
MFTNTQVTLPAIRSDKLSCNVLWKSSVCCIRDRDRRTATAEVAWGANNQGSGLSTMSDEGGAPFQHIRVGVSHEREV